MAFSFAESVTGPSAELRSGTEPTMSEPDEISCCYCGAFLRLGNERLDRHEYCDDREECMKFAIEMAEAESYRDAVAYADADDYRAYR